MSAFFSKSCASAKPFPLMPGNFSYSLSDDAFSEWKSPSFEKKKIGSVRFRSKCLQIKAVETSSVGIDHQWGAQRRTLAKAPASLKIAIIGFGNYGQFLAKTFVSQGHTVLAHSRTDYSDAAGKLGVSFFRDPHDLCEEHPDVMILCTSVLSTKSVLKSIPFERLRRSTLFVDVLSVKEFARNLFLEILPKEFDILCTHPMFGPESGKSGWAGLPFVYDKVRIGNEDPRITRCREFLDVFGKEGCRMVEMSCAEHDKYAAESQFITHTIGRILERFGLESNSINTKGHETLLKLVENNKGKDSFDLYYGFFMYNNDALEQLEKLELAFQSLKRELSRNLQSMCRRQLFEEEGV